MPDAPIVAPVPVQGAVPPAPVPPAEPEHATETLYIQNLNEKIKLPVLKQSLRGLFKTYGEVLDVVAHDNLRMRGQAFVSFESADVAKKALKEVRGFPLYSKPMQISFARSRSDAVVKKLDPTTYDTHKARRLEHKKATRYTNPLKAKFRAKRLAAEIDGGAVPVSKRPAVQMPDEYLPPNKILFLQNLPENPYSSRSPILSGKTILDIRTCTKFVLSQRRRILPSWNIWTRQVQL
ncbi:unnamed protein product [Somion occarium]|uniref:RRM domain-containing protein n=1 Tax=Somion occarium TaxID=3059160 RepID=A0ABP1CGS3_9APHY